MARLGIESGELGLLEERYLPDGAVEGYFVQNPASSADSAHVDPVLLT